MLRESGDRAREPPIGYVQDGSVRRSNSRRGPGASRARRVESQSGGRVRVSSRAKWQPCRRHLDGRGKSSRHDHARVVQDISF